jgi:DnaA family protein
LAQTHGIDVVHWQVQSSQSPQDPFALSTEFEFKASWRMMVIDDVHLMSEQDQATAFNWFVNAFAPGDHATRMVIMSSDQQVGSLAIREDLRTRMAQGLCLELKTLDEQACRTVLIEQARLRGLVLKADVLDFMMARFSRDLTNLVGWLDQLDAFSLQTQRAITIPLIKDMLNAL